MLSLNWDPKLELGIDLIDQQHRNIIEKASQFFIAYVAGHPERSLEDCLAFLEQYVMYHFQAEEAFQSGCQYPGLRDHQAQHNMLRMQFKFQSTKLSASHFAKADIDDFYTFLQEWIFEHILMEDMQFSEFYRAYQSAQS